MQGCAQAAHLPASLTDPPTLHPFNKTSLINEALKKLLQGTHSPVYSLGLCHLVCEMAGCEYVSSSAQTLSLSGQLCGGWAPAEDVDPWQPRWPIPTLRRGTRTLNFSTTCQNGRKSRQPYVPGTWKVLINICGMDERLLKFSLR